MLHGSLRCTPLGHDAARHGARARQFYGWLLAIIMAPLSVSTSFLVVRSIGGQPLSENSSGWTRAVLSNLDERPYTTIVVVSAPAGHCLLTGTRSSACHAAHIMQ